MGSTRDRLPWYVTMILTWAACFVGAALILGCICVLIYLAVHALL